MQKIAIFVYYVMIVSAIIINNLIVTIRSNVTMHEFKKAFSNKIGYWRRWQWLWQS